MVQLKVSNLVFYGQHAVESLHTNEHKVLKEVALRERGVGGRERENLNSKTLERERKGGRGRIMMCPTCWIQNRK